MGADRLGRGARRNRPASQAARRRERAGERGVRHHHAVWHRHSGLVSLDRAPAPRLRQPQRALRHGDLQLPPGRHLRAHLRRRHADARFPERRLHRPLGAQPEHHLARLCQPGRRSEGARRQAHRRRSAPRRPRGQGGCVAARQARQRRGARTGPRQPAPGSRALRRGLHAGLDQRPAAGARRRRQPAPRRPPECGRRPGAQGGVGCGRRRADALRPRLRPLRRRGARARRTLRDRGRGRHGDSLPDRVRSLSRALPPLHGRTGRGDHLGAGGRSSVRRRG